MSTLYKLTLVPYLQAWDHASRTLSIRLLVAPTGNPLEPLLTSPSGIPAFADAKMAFEVSISDASEALPQRDLVDQTTILPDPAGGSATIDHPKARDIFTALQAALDIPDTSAGNTFAAQSRDTAVQIRKYLPNTYRKAFPFVRPRTSLALIDKTYQCLLKCPPKKKPPEPPTTIGWGEALAFALRRPRLAEELGLIVPLDIPLDAAPRLEKGGWLWVGLAPASDYSSETSDPNFMRSFATRVPALPTGNTRPLFTPVIFPVSKDATEAATLGNFDKVFVEAIRFDDGYSKIVHARQPLSPDLLDEEGSGIPILRDEGIQLGWDDEDILEGQNRAIGAPPDGEDAVLAPRGVLGYRVDVRKEGTLPWTSLSKVESPCTMGVDLGTAIEERWSEVYPVDHGDGEIWMPVWFVNWRGGSLVIDTKDEKRLMDVYTTEDVPDVPVDTDDIPLRYGDRYEFRVRMADATGGGPGIDTSPVQPGESPIYPLHMKRHRQPSAVGIDKVVVDSNGVVPSVRFWRPKLGYPEAVFAAGPSARTELLNQIAANDADPDNANPPGIYDPDTAYLRVRVLIKAPTYDPAGDEEGFVEWYQTSRPFPSNPESPLDLTLSFVNSANYDDIDISAQLGADGTITGDLILPTARDVRLEVRALGKNDLAYFYDEASRLGRIKYIDFHAVAAETAETDALAVLPDSDTLRSVFLQPDPIGDRAEVHAVVAQNDASPLLLDRLASAVELVADGSALVGQEGERVAFGCSGLANYIAPDSTSIEFSEPDELAGLWINVVQVVLDRDWTWRGAGSPTLKVYRQISLPDGPGGDTELTEVGSIELMHTINVQATRRPERTYTRLVFLDAVPPPLGDDGYPYEVDISYKMTLSLEGGGKVEQQVDSILPIVTPPKQVPKVVAAGLALTPYEHDVEYAVTGTRTKRLWIEFDQPILDPRDAYFAKPLYKSPDPMLLPGVEPVADPEVVEGIALDPELARVITPGQVQDLSGLSTMQKLYPSADSDRRFLVPLPPNTDPNSPELFSFFTYEIRVGHDQGPADNPLWSTAQGRFGEALELGGVQHPAPAMTCFAIPEPDGAIRVRAPYAMPYVGLRQVLPDPPNTQIWIVLYARVMQADGSTKRNIQISLQQARYLPLKLKYQTVPRVREAEARWSGAEVEAALQAAGLPLDSPITALAVELIPEPNSSFSDPLGGDLGQVRILRTSPLASIERCCCTA